ncbi:MAG: alpha/beta hydrolase [Labilithrix sp.]|nr:alpha/beta hydrolase [Labilithrix sp.]MCW5815216.1 alpha/beta hydrolase [Labilithrix sp.]
MASDPFSKMLGVAAGAFDRAFAAAIQARGRRDRAEADKMPHAERLAKLAAVASLYSDAAHAEFFPRPRHVDLTLRDVRPGVAEAHWRSAFEPYVSAVADRYLSHVENRTARARLYLGAGKRRAAVIAIHGYMGGAWLLEENTWPIEWLQRRGLDVALPVLPFHAGRGGLRSGAPKFPSADPRMTNEGFRQAVADVRTLVRWLRDRGAPHVGVMGMSLGGYTTSLVATVVEEGEIDFVMPMIPLASIADFAREQGRLGLGAEADEQHAALERANWVASPLARPLRIPKTRALVVAAENDRITPVTHAERIAKHFDCELRTVGGAHLIQIGRGDAFRALAAMLERDGILARR